MQARAFVFCAQPGDHYRVGRTLRSLAAAGVEAEEIVECAPAKLGSILREGGPILFVRAGTWLVRPEGFGFPRASATGKGLCAVGAVRLVTDSGRGSAELDARWRELFARTGGDFSGLDGSTSAGSDAPLPDPASLYLDATAAGTLSGTENLSLDEILRVALKNLRLVHFAPLDVHDDPGLRVLQVVTSLQRGGAERVTLDLMAALPAHDVRVRLATLGRPLRESFPSPPETVDLSQGARNSEARRAGLVRLAMAFGADLVHGHLLTAEDARYVSAHGLPLCLTVHNTRPGWHAGLADLRAGDATLLAACSQAVARDLRAADISTAIRTARNGIDLCEFRLTPDREAAGRKWRQTWGFGESDLVLIAVANPRPQKRLHLLPEVLAAIRAKLPPDCQARLVFCGEAAAGHPEAEQCTDQIRGEISRLGLNQHVRWTGATADVAGVLVAADVLVSASAHEGLSLAQLEAVAMGCFVVATDAGGEREIAQDNPSVHVLPRDASPELFAQTILTIKSTTRSSRHELGVLRGEWSREHMAARYHWLYSRAIVTARPRQPGRGIWLITNNFSTGGAQSSARRLLIGLATQGIPVRAAVIEEHPSNPTPGRRALVDTGISVVAIPPESPERTRLAVQQLLMAIDSDPPQAVVFWNLRPGFKLLLADALLNVPIFDVSPGEMFFESLQACFAKARPGLPYRTPRDYGALLAGVIVKYRAEASQAGQTLGAPVHVVPNGVPLRELAEVRITRRDRLVFGTATRISPRKRLEDLFEAFRIAYDRLPSCVLKIAGGVESGSEDYAARLRGLAEGLPVEWLGEMSDLSAFHRELDVFVMISEPAGCPNASLEAMAAGLPVIATDVGGASEQVLDGRTGRLVPARDSNALAAAITELAADLPRREQMGLAARDHVRDRFNLTRMVEDYRRIFLSLS